MPRQDGAPAPVAVSVRVTPLVAPLKVLLVSCTGFRNDEVQVLVVQRAVGLEHHRVGER